MKKIPVALQLWSVREAAKADFAATVAQVAQIGYAGVELAGTGNLAPAAARQALADAGLRVAGMHVGIARLRQELNQVVDEALLFQTRHVVCPFWPPAQLRTASAFTRIGEELGQIGAYLRDFGLRLSFHNHATEFFEFDGRRGFDWLLDAAAPRDLGCELDVYWSHVGGKPPEQFIREQGRRIALLHLKDEKELGLGPVDFGAVFAAADAIGAVEWQIVEQEKFNHPPLDSVRLCFQKLQEWGRV